MRTWTIRRRILATFAILLVSMVGIATWAYTRLARIEDQATLVETTSLPGLYHAAQIATAFNLDYALTQEYVLQTDLVARSKQLDHIRTASAALQDLIAKYEPTVLNADDRGSAAAIRQTVESFRSVQETILAPGSDAKANRDAAATLAQELDPAFEKGAALLDTTVNRRRDTMESETRDILRAANSAEVGVVLSFASVVLLAFACGYYLLGAITRPLAELSDQLQRSGLQVNTSVTEIAATARQQQVMATEVASMKAEIATDPRRSRSAPARRFR